MSEPDPVLDEACRRITWSYYGLDNYCFMLRYETSLNGKDELRDEYNRLKKDTLGPYWKPEDAFEVQYPNLELLEPSPEL